MTRRNYRGTDIQVSFDADLCIHARECVRGLPAVFNRGRRPWILADNAPTEEVTRVVEDCPTGALQYRLLDGSPGEQPAATSGQAGAVDGARAGDRGGDVTRLTNG